jgi:predicted nucleic acid-binding protein
MDLVVDANILFAALIKKGATSNLLFSNELHLYAPEFLLNEFEKYRDLIIEKTERPDIEFEELLSVYLRRINFVPTEEIVPYLTEARKISPDPNDAVYFAVALKVNASLWSNDSILKKQDKIKVYSTKELIKIVQPC